MKVTVKAYAKINLLLDICALRKDGYHDLFMLMQSVGLYDTVTVERVKGRNITIFCDDSDVPTDEHNIAYKAAEAFFSDYKIRKTSRGLRITIQKRIPHAAGLAGGSADGAAVLTALNEIYGTGLTARELCATGVKIGADVPFCLTGGTLLSQGIGEILSPVKPLRRCYIVLAKPDQGVNTGAAFASLTNSARNTRLIASGCCAPCRRATCRRLLRAWKMFLSSLLRCRNVFILKKRCGRTVRSALV